MAGTVETPNDEQFRQLPLFERYRPAVDTYIRNFLTQEAGLAEPMISYHMGYKDSNGKQISETFAGKGIRPTLCLLTADALGATWENVVPAAAALELFHNFALIHDDIQDGDEKRHNRPTVWKIMGVGQAINIGDSASYVSTLSVFDLLKRGFRPDEVNQATRLLSSTAIQVIDGQIRDLGLEGRLNVEIDEYLEMISRKTGKLVEASVLMGATLATSDSDTLGKLQKLGFHLGRGFQLADDLLGIWGEESKTGKKAFGDIRKRKKTLPVILALNHKDKDGAEQIRNIYSQQKSELDDDDIEKVLEIFEQMNIRKEAGSMLEASHAEAIATIGSLDLGWATRDFTEAANKLAFRIS